MRDRRGWRQASRSVVRRNASGAPTSPTLEAMERAFEGAEVVVPHGRDPPIRRRRWRSSSPSNVIGGYNALEACRRQGVRRIVYASTVMTDWGYQFDEPYKGDQRRALRRGARRLPPRHAPGPATADRAVLGQQGVGEKASAARTPTVTACPACACASVG